MSYEQAEVATTQDAGQEDIWARRRRLYGAGRSASIIWRAWPWYTFCAGFGVVFLVIILVQRQWDSLAPLGVWTLLAAAMARWGYRQTHLDSASAAMQRPLRERSSPAWLYGLGVVSSFPIAWLVVVLLLVTHQFGASSGALAVFPAGIAVGTPVWILYLDDVYRLPLDRANRGFWVAGLLLLWVITIPAYWIINVAPGVRRRGS